MSKQFIRKFRVRWSETNALGQVGLAGCLRYLIETAWDWGATNGMGRAESASLGLAWVIRETELTLMRPLAANEVFDFRIWLLDWRRVRGRRCFELRMKDSESIIARGVQQVVTLDSNTLRPVTAPQEVLENFLMENPPVIEQRKFPVLQPQPDTAFVTQRDVEWRDLDELQHVNNAVYAAYVEDAATQVFAALGWPPSELRRRGLAVQNQRFHIRYLSPALWGDRLRVSTSAADLSRTGGTWHIDIKRLSNSESIAQCVMEWSVVDRAGGIEQTVPESLFYAINKRVSGATKNAESPS